MDEQDLHRNKENYEVTFVQKNKNSSEPLKILAKKEFILPKNMNVSQTIRIFTHKFQNQIFQQHNIKIELNETQNCYQLFIGKKTGMPKTSYPALYPEEDLQKVGYFKNRLSLVYDCSQIQQGKSQNSDNESNNEQKTLGTDDESSNVNKSRLFDPKNYSFAYSTNSYENYVENNGDSGKKIEGDKRILKYSQSMEGIFNANTKYHNNNKQNQKQLYVVNEYYLNNNNNELEENIMQNNQFLQEDNNNTDIQVLEYEKQLKQKKKQQENRKQRSSSFWDFFGCCGHATDCSTQASNNQSNYSKKYKKINNNTSNLSLQKSSNASENNFQNIVNQ